MGFNKMKYIQMTLSGQSETYLMKHNSNEQRIWHQKYSTSNVKKQIHWRNTNNESKTRQEKNKEVKLSNAKNLTLNQLSDVRKIKRVENLST